MIFYVEIENKDVYCIQLGYNLKYFAIIGEALYYKGYKLGKVINIYSEEEYYASLHGSNRR